MPWPALPLADWEPTYATLHRWTQIVGKVRLAAMPWTNHAWHTPLYVTPRGLSTGLVPHDAASFELAFDFVDHRLHLTTEDGRAASFNLQPMASRPMSVAAFCDLLTHLLAAHGIDMPIWPVPVEIPGDVLPFDEDEANAAYDADAAHRHWQILVASHRVFTRFRARFIGKSSPVHFFWGAFDLALTRFSGRTAPAHPGGAPNCADWVMEEAYSHEVSSAGFWAGAGLGEPAYYAYAYPEPEGYRTAAVRPEAAYYHADLGEYVLPYEAVRTADDPDAALLDFLQTTYEAAADLADWDRAALERPALPAPHRA
ncbi:MAG: DUF5996 family protein [Bacteroidota bacterium]